MTVPSFWSRLRAWLRARPVLVDGVIAAVLAVVCVWSVLAAWQQVRGMPELAGSDLRAPSPLSIGLDLAATLSLAARRRWPLAVGGLVTVTVTTSLALGFLSLSFFVVFFAAYAVGAYVGVARGALWVGLSMIALLTVELTGSGTGQVSNAVLNPLVTGGVWWIGRNVRLRRAYTAELENRARRLERARDAYARAALAEERARVARELHDVVAHHVSVMTVQATAAGRVMGRDPDRAREALDAVQATGRVALTEMRRLVGVLRTDRDAGAPAAEQSRSPQPGVADVGELVRRTRAAGLPVVLRTEGAPRPLSTGVDLAVYRVVQEALTNTLKHAGPVPARVVLRFSDAEMLVEVRDEGRRLIADPGPEVDPPDQAGHGLVGMRERVALYDGRLDAGPAPGGGYAVRARFPITENRVDAPDPVPVTKGRENEESS